MLMEFTAALSGIATLGVGLNLVVNLRSKRDMAVLKNEILESINGKYVSRTVHEEIERGRDKSETQINECLEELEEKITETRKYHHELHEEFIACRASHKGD